ncbi:LysR family transcriptional regulator [Motilimonas eburnea]|uniref:LysR family transcriptional regulator n=1 Tax=Motilimonas eburnea TaxID=1737488 RepID=UPI001E50254C|nr:LysR family transcriptional regulator [Motilimonas eburnea]MCE2571272.1 LysR family transcriptional regulator [Motilimonas eburnea]
MDQLHLMKVLVAVAEHESFAMAAKALNMSPPAVSRAITSLETNLGVSLLKRTTRFVRATEAGLSYVEDARRILEDIERANQAVMGINTQPKGNLAITAPVLFGQRHVLPVVLEYLRCYPDTKVNAAFVDRTVNLLEEGFDLGIRIGELKDSGMRARKVGEVSLVTVASPDYLKRHGQPSHPNQLKHHTLIASNSNDFSRDWQFMDKGNKLAQRIHPRLTVTTNQAAIEAAISGLGITRAVSYQVADAIAANQLCLLLNDYQTPPLPIHIIHQESHHSSSKVRAFIDLMVQRFQHQVFLPPSG